MLIATSMQAPIVLLSTGHFMKLKGVYLNAKTLFNFMIESVHAYMFVFSVCVTEATRHKMILHGNFYSDPCWEEQPTNLGSFSAINAPCTIKLSKCIREILKEFGL